MVQRCPNGTVLSCHVPLATTLEEWALYFNEKREMSWMQERMETCLLCHQYLRELTEFTAKGNAGGSVGSWQYHSSHSFFFSQENHNQIPLLHALNVFCFPISYPPSSKGPVFRLSFRLMFTYVNFQCYFHMGQHIWIPIFLIACDPYPGVLARVCQENSTNKMHVKIDGESSFPLTFCSI